MGTWSPSVRRSPKRNRARKRWGQHFLKDRSAAHRIVAAAETGPEDLVIEIGPGRGALTSLLAESAGRVIGVEVDRSLCQEMDEAFGDNPSVTFLNASILDVDLCDLVRRSGFEKAVVVGNLPFNLTGPILQQLIRSRSVVDRSVLMVQREVGRRLRATSGKEYGILTISVQLFAKVTGVFDLPPNRFSPSPKVHSSVLKLEFRDPPLVDIEDEARFFEVVRTAFQQRRKMLRNTVSRLVGNDDSKTEAVFRLAGVDPRLRPAAVDPHGFERIARAIARTAV